MDKPHAAYDMHTDDFLLLLFHSPKRHTASITHIDNVGALLRFVEQTSQIHPSMFMVVVKKLLRQSTAYVLAATCVISLVTGSRSMPKCES